MTSDAQYMSTLYFVVFFKFIFVIFYSINLYGLMFNQQIYNNTLKWVIVMEFIFMISMAFILLYLFNKDTITVKSEEQVLIWTMAFVIVIDGFIKVSSIQW
jgi:hypothetical protein